MIRLLAVVLLIISALAPVKPRVQTHAVPSDPDDPAIWRHPSNPGESLVIATDKIEGTGGLYVFGLDGKLRQSITPLDRPNNVDVEYGMRFGGTPMDIAVVTERRQRRLRIFRVQSSGTPLVDLAPGGLPVLVGQTGDASEPMGVAIYKRPRDGAAFVIVAPKSGDKTNYLWQYRLATAADGAIRADLVRRFGHFSQKGELLAAGEIEAVVADDELGFVYYADERFGIRKWHADPDHPAASQEIAVFGIKGYRGDREGLAVYRSDDGRGYLVSTDQVSDGSRLFVYRREGNNDLVGVVDTASDETDGIDVSSLAFPGFPRGLLVMMNSGPKNFLYYSWEDVLSAGGLTKVARYPPAAAAAPGY